MVDPLKVDPLIEEKVSTETPEDVAVLYNWANLQGAQYRDFSASRREYRAQMHRRAAEQRRKETAERTEQEAAAAAQREADLREAAHLEAAQAEAARIAVARQAEELQRQREEQIRAAAVAIAAEAAAAQAAAVYRQPSRAYEEVRSAPQEIIQPAAQELHQAAQELRQATADVRRATEEVRHPAAEIRQPVREVRYPAQEVRPAAEEYRPAAPVVEEYRPAPVAPQPPIEAEETFSRATDAFKLPTYAALPSFSPRESAHQSLPNLYKEPAPAPAPPKAEPVPQFPSASTPIPAYRPEPAARQETVRTKPQPAYTPEPPAYVPPVVRTESRRTYIPSPPVPQYTLPENAQPIIPAAPVAPQYVAPQTPAPQQPAPETAFYPAYPSYTQDVRYTPEPRETTAAMPAVPAGQPEWLYTGSVPVAAQQTSSRRATGTSPISDTLQYSRERVASRWFALKGIFEAPNAEPEVPPTRQKETQPPMLALFSLAGGVGKTSMVATLGRTLSSLGEKTLLLDTTAYGLLPFYFGARELRPNTMRTFAPPVGSADAPIHMISMNVESKAPEAGAPDSLIEDIQRNARGTNRIVVDVTTAAAPLARRIMKMAPTVLVPVAPDMNSVISLNAVEQFFKGQVDAEGRPVKVFYLLNQFDPSQPLHLDVREVLRQQLGDRLLPFVIRRSPAVSEALAEGMTVMDYAPNSPAAEDYMNFANWLRNISAPVTAGFRGVRWSEQP